MLIAFMTRIQIMFGLSLRTIGRTRLHPIFLLTALVVGIIVILATWQFQRLFPNQENRFPIFRDLIFIGTAVVAFPFAMSRTLTAERTLLNERYQKGIDMLASDDLIVRLGGIFALKRLSEERPEDYHPDVVKLLSLFIRQSKHDRNKAEERHYSEDLQAAINFLKLRRTYHRRIESLEGYKILDLSGADLEGLDLSEGNLNNTNFDDAKLANANLSKTKFRGCSLKCTDLTNADVSATEGLYKSAKTSGLIL